MESGSGITRARFYESDGYAVIDLSDHNITFLGLAVGAIAAVIGAVTVGLVWRQIGIGEDQVKIAKRQITLAEDQKEIAQKEIVLVEQQGKILEHQEQEMNRKARLVLWGKRIQVSSMSGNENGVELGIGNFGNRTADRCTIRLLISQNGPSPEVGTTRATFGQDYFRLLDIAPEYDGKIYAAFELDINRLFFQGTEVVLPFIFMTPTRAENVLILYRLTYSDDATPNYSDYFTLMGSPTAASTQQLESQRTH
jgi:hypothetical protein